MTLAILLCAAWCTTSLALTAALFYQQRFFMEQIQTLINKSMSGSFEGYNRAVNPPPRPPPIPEPQEDLRALNEFLS